MEQKKSSEENKQWNKINNQSGNGSNNKNNSKDEKGLLSASECLEENKNKSEKKNSMDKQKLIKKYIDQHRYYEAHHMIKTMVNRNLKKMDITECLEIIFYFCPAFAKQNEYTVICDLMLICINVLIEHNVPFTENFAKKIIDIFKMCLSESCEEKYKFMNKAVLWSKKEKRPFGYRPFHEAMGHAYLKEKRFHLAHNHYLYIDNSSYLFDLLYDWQEAAYPSEAPYFVLRSVLSLIVLDQFRVAYELVFIFADNLDDKNVPLPLQLAYLINVACVYNSKKLYEDVKYRYRLIINFDPEFQKFLKEIDVRVFSEHKSDTVKILHSMLD